MIGRRAVIGLSLLSALLVCAFAAQSASAIETKASKNTTAFTCVPDPTEKGDFKDAHCDETDIGKGKFTHQLIKVGETTSIEATNQKVTNETTEHQTAVLRGTIAGIKAEIDCTKVKNNTANSWIRNVEPEAGQHTFEGTVETEFTECTVTKPQAGKCIVSEPIVSQATVHGVEGMKGPKEEPNAMGLEFVGHGPDELFASITFTNKPGQECTLHNKTFPVKGRVVATNGPTTEKSGQENRETGATSVFTPKFNMQTLTFGGKPAEFEAITTATMAGVGGNPIALTTTT